MSKKPGKSTRLRGRPRRDGSSSDASPRDSIVRAATYLFAEYGFASTTITQIAAKAGLQQSSIYYWFSSKEQILQATLGVNRKALNFADDVIVGSEPVAVKLYRLLHYDTHELCISSLDFNEVERLAESRSEEFSDFWRDYASLHQHVCALIDEGVVAGEFECADSELAASAALCLNEGFQKRYRSQAQHSVESSNPFVLHQQNTPAEYARMSAYITLRSLMSNIDQRAIISLQVHAEKRLGFTST